MDKSFLLLCLLGLFLCTAVSAEDATVEENLGKAKDGSKTDDEVVAREEEAIKLDGMSVAQMKEMRASAQKHTFQAEVDRMMKLIINSLYKNKEIFLRELISNASDALDKIRFLSLTKPEILGDHKELNIKIKADNVNKVLHITDTGIGMTGSELVKNLGTIAKSGTSDFMSKVQSATTAAEANDLIGQFGVGFYSAFLVADRVIVTSKHNDDVQHIWESDSGSFTIVKDPRGNTLGRGTTVSVFLKEEAHDFLEPTTIRNLVIKYSQFINFDIFLWTGPAAEEKMDEQPDMEPPAEKKEGEDEDAAVEDDTDTADKKAPSNFWEIINNNKPIWTRKSSEVTSEEYNGFYKAFTKDEKDALAHTHFVAEGEVTFKSILYIPTEAPRDMFSNYGKRKEGIKMYVRRVFITDDFEEMLPKYLSFIRGVVDSDDLPLNVSRETLQQNKLLKVIRKKLVRKTLDMIKKITKEQFDAFWKEYSTNIKLGVMEDHSNRTRLAKLLRFYSSHSADYTTLEAYVERMKENQEHIYFVAGTSRADVEKSPFVETLLKKGYEVLYLIEAVDEYCIQNLPEFDGKKFQNVAKEGLKIDESEKAKERKEALTKEFEPLTKWLAENALKDKIEKAVISERLHQSPCALIASAYGWSGNMQRLMKSQTHTKANDPNSEHYGAAKRTLEINPGHPLVKELRRRSEADAEDATAKDLAVLLWETATIRSGYELPDSQGFGARVERMLRLSMNIDPDEKVEEFEDKEEAAEATEEVIADEADDETKPEPKATTECPTCRKLMSVHDKDGDGAPDHLDDDDDNDGIPDWKEKDTDGDGKPDYLDSDDDGDGIADSQDKDDDGDGVPDSQEEDETKDTDGDGKPDHLDSDDDGDGIPDSKDDDDDGDGIPDWKEKDTDGDGKPDYLDSDDDNDGIPDWKEQDTDGDGKPDHLDSDDDGDGIPDWKEKDTDGDGKPDYVDSDDDGDGVPDTEENEDRVKDTDGDGVPDYLDSDDDGDGIPDDKDDDDDGDGIPDWKEKDTDGDGKPDYLDSDDDGDGISDDKDGDDDGDGINDNLEKDTDGDGKPDHLDSDDDGDGVPDDKDSDDDNDGIPDWKEKDTDGDGKPDYLDSDDDGDGVPDDKDSDDDGDGVHDSKEVDHTRDTDGDGKPDHLDSDDDGDGIPDDKDGDDDGDGIHDSLEKDTDGDGKPDHLDSDDDGDGVPDTQDSDDDGDGISDDKEKDTDGDGIPDFVDDDDDNDGIPDAQDDDDDGDGIPDWKEKDTDGDGKPDYLDSDDDGDGVPDTEEKEDRKKDTDGDGVPDYLDSDDDGDGIPDDKDDDDDNDGIPDWKEKDTDGDGKPDYLDSDDDGDGTPDTQDHDDDGDGVPDSKEDHTKDTDGDGVPDYLDSDDDNDGIPDSQDDDDDGDGIPDAEEERMKDSDGDGKPDYLDSDDDGDGVPDSQDGDDDGDGIPDGHEDLLKDTDGDGKPDHLDSDDDGDGVPDSQDSDDDGDGISDAQEASTKDTDGDGKPDHLDSDDDGDGVPDTQDSDDDGDGIPDSRQRDTDGDGVPDYLDSDDDGDGIPDNRDNDDDGDGVSDDDDDDNDNEGVLRRVLDGLENFFGTEQEAEIKKKEAKKAAQKKAHKHHEL